MPRKRTDGHHYFLHLKWDIWVLHEPFSIEERKSNPGTRKGGLHYIGYHREIMWPVHDWPLRGAQQWILIVRGVRRLDPARGLLAFMWVVVKAAVVGALVGFVVGWLLGSLWERWHRRRRA